MACVVAAHKSILSASFTKGILCSSLLAKQHSRTLDCQMARQFTETRTPQSWVLVEDQDHPGENSYSAQTLKQDHLTLTLGVV